MPELRDEVRAAKAAELLEVASSFRPDYVSEPCSKLRL